MTRRKKHIWQQLRDQTSLPYDRGAGRVLYGEHDVKRWYVEPGQDAEGNLVSGGYESEPTAHPTLKRWIDALMAFDDHAHHNAAPLRALLESETERLPIVGVWLKDLIRRHGIGCTVENLASALHGFVWSRPKGRPGRLAYDLTLRDEELYVDNAKVTEYLKQHGGSVPNAIAAVISKKVRAAGYSDKLTRFRKGQDNGARRAAKHRRR